uniref:TIR domain-containing protein n=1 Tax=Steinernema glaseri TaxID=37863 RepID=A0A1I7ZTM3_9BILA
MFKDARPESVSRDLIQRFPHAGLTFAFRCSSINEAWVDFACSLKRTIKIIIAEKLEDEAVGLLQRFVDARKLSTITVHEEACEDGIIAVLKSFLCQDQFREVEVGRSSEGPWESGVVGELLQFWSQSSEKLRGKRLALLGQCEGGVKQLEEFLLPSLSPLPFVLQMVKTSIERLWSFMLKTLITFTSSELRGILKICSKEECDAISKEYRHEQMRFHKPSCIYKFEEGERNERRRLYIFFECATKKERRTERPKLPANHKGLDDLGLMRDTSSLQVLFA